MNPKTKKGILGQAHQTWLGTPGGRRGFQLRGTGVAMEGSGHELLLRYDAVGLCQSGLATHQTKLNDLARWLTHSGEERQFLRLPGEGGSKVQFGPITKQSPDLTV